MVIAIEPMNAPARNGIGMAYAEAGNPDEAVKWFRKALEVDSRYLVAAVNIQDVLEKTGRYAEAIGELQSLVDVMPENDELRIQLARLYRSLGHLDLAIETVTEALRRSPNNIEALKLYGMLLQATGKGERAKDVYRKIVRLDPKQYSFRVDLARLYRESGDAKAAIKELDEYLVSRPTDVSARIELARAHGDLGDHEHATQILREVLAGKPDDAEALLELSAAYQAMGDKERAVEAADRLVNLRGGRGKAEDMDSLGDSISTYEKAVRAYSSDMREAWERNIKVLRDSLRSEAQRDAGTPGDDLGMDTMLDLSNAEAIAVDEAEELVFLDEREEPLDSDLLDDEQEETLLEDEDERVDELLVGEDLYPDAPAAGRGSDESPDSGEAEAPPKEAPEPGQRQAEKPPVPSEQAHAPEPSAAPVQEPPPPQPPQPQQPQFQQPQPPPYQQSQPPNWPPYPSYPPYPEPKPKKPKPKSDPLQDMDLSQPLEDGLSLDDDFPPFGDMPPEAETIPDDDSLLDELPPEFGDFPGSQDELPEEPEDFPEEFESLPEEFEDGTDDFEVLPEYIEESDFDADGEDTSFEDELLPDVAGGLGEPDLPLDSGDFLLEPDAVSAPVAATPAKPPARAPVEKPGQKDKKRAPKAGVDPFGEEAARLYRYLKDLSLSLPPEKKQAMEASGVSAKLDAIIEHSAGHKPPERLPDEIYGVPVSPRLAKLIEFMRREKQHGGK